jgi:two-component system response regulator HupR/HoxA
MDQSSTIVVLPSPGSDWTAALDVLTERYAYRAIPVGSVAEALTTMGSIHVDLAVAEDGADERKGIDFLTRLRVSHPDIMRVYVAPGADHVSEPALAQAAIFQLLLTPLHPYQLGLVVERALETRELSRRHRILSREFKISGNSLFLDHHKDLASPPVRHGFPISHRFEKLVYASEKMAELCDLARQAARTELPILIQGETGTGKELLARAIHYNSQRRTSPLLVQNCGGMSDDLLHSELFGHRRGAFTGAVADRLGLFRAADGGTVFLDEISEVSPSFQVSLLRFLQEGEVKPLGSDRVLHCNVRIIAASNKPLAEMVERGAFRRDLYFRLKGFELEVPPLRERPDDIGPLAEFLAAKHADAMGRKILGITANTIEKLSACELPGNVRELENEIRRMVALAKDGEYLTTRDMSPALLAAAARNTRSPLGFVPEGKTLRDQVESLERQIVGRALLRNHWNQSRTAAELGLSRVGLANKIRRYSLEKGA